MKSVIIASLFVLAGTAAQAEIVCSERGCWETGVKIILVDPSYVRGQPMTSHRNGNSSTGAISWRSRRDNSMSILPPGSALSSAQHGSSEPRYAVLPRQGATKEPS